MAQTIIRIQTKLMKEYYQYFSKYAKGKQQECKVAWITAFAPVEILETLVQRFFDAHILSRLFLTSIFPVKCFGC